MKKKGKVIEKPTSQDGGGGADRERSAAADPAVGQRHRAGRQEDAQDEGEKPSTGGHPPGEPRLG